MSQVLDVENRSQDYDSVFKGALRTETGLRAICFMYDDHSKDKNSYENIIKLKDNIQYRLFSAAHQYLVFLKELNSAESYLKKVFSENPQYLSAFPLGNPFFEKIELELSSLFDNIIFQLASTFDYLSHVICYITFENKANTLYWPNLAKKARDKSQEFSKKEICETVRVVDKRFVGRLYDYRSRLFHSSRDKHLFEGDVRLNELEFMIRLMPSERALKEFSIMKDEIGSLNPTLTFLSSWLLKKSFSEIEEILSSLQKLILGNSHLAVNMNQPKRNSSFFIGKINSTTFEFEPFSEELWRQYKSGEGNP